MTELRVVSYNIYFGDEGMTERTKGIITEIKALLPLPDVIAFQEVTYFSDKQLRDAASELGYAYISMVDDRPRLSYFCSLMVSPRIDITSNIKTMFPKTAMERHLVGIEGKFKDSGRPVYILTSHLESMRHERKTRLLQLDYTMNLLQTVASPDTLAIFMGDTNLEDDEMPAGSLPASVRDAWVHLGCDVSTKFTWDLSVNDMFISEEPHPQRRYDRVFYTKTSDLRPKRFQLIGTKKLPCGYFPSDHWGVMVDFDTAGPSTGK